MTFLDLDVLRSWTQHLSYILTDTVMFLVINAIYPPIQQHAHTPTSLLHPILPGADYYLYLQGQDKMIPNLQQHHQVAIVQHEQSLSSIPRSTQLCNTEKNSVGNESLGIMSLEKQHYS